MFATAHDALFTQGGLGPGERLLVNGAAGGVGLAAVQLGVSLGARVTANARHSHDKLRALGADTDVEGLYDVILELVGGELLQRDPELLATGGAAAGDRDERRPPGRGRFRRAHARPRADPGVDAPRPAARGEGAGRTRGSSGTCCRSSTAGRVGVPVDRTFPLADAEAAYDAFAAGGKFGKLVLTV